jgi:formylglycine-generating enzyme required for sulfatase activity
LERTTWAGVSLALLLSCSNEKPARPQVVLHVDVDMPLTVALGDDVSHDAAVDTLRIEVFTSDKKLVDSRLFSVSSKASLPLSFGIPASVAKDGRALIRLRAFRAAYASPGKLNDAPVLDPLARLSVDRLVTLTFSKEGVVDASVILHGECFGAPVRFGLGGELGRTCIDAAHADVESTSGVTVGAPKTSVAGSWSRAVNQPCRHAPPDGAICIPGGLSVLGDPLFLARSELELDATPGMLVDHSPFFLDTDEVTVGELRALVARGYGGPLPSPRDQAKKKDCTWDPAAPDADPVNCISPELADAVCAAKGGHVVSEAQWEHAARGRGERRLFAWGDEEPECCSASLAKLAGGGCLPLGPEPIGSHLDEGGCKGDVTRDGVVDMTGSVAELTLDSVASYLDPCWASPGGILKDPVCRAAVGRVARGAGWAFAFGDAALPIRRNFTDSDAGFGFRCAYEDKP